MINNQKGFTLTELIAGVALTTLLFAGFIMFLLQFYGNFKEIAEYNTLQHELLETIEALRYGYVKQGVNDNESIIGLLTANNVNIASNNKSVTITPIVVKAGERHWASYSLSAKGEIILNAVYGIKNINGEVIFPKSKEVIDKNLKYKITEFQIRNISPFISDKISLVSIVIEGQVRFRPKQSGQNKVEDERLNTKSARFETKVYISNYDN
ncbi:MAG TPA: prepilin-type N-terminal cleavage/methylation domain-containing protein [Candidatus Cloacimonadota bacterium]|nr:prepilin-type N-terminal cleavage/methylation domain-containing protein [Candidatus Cloacimonadota bacterium]HOQ80321.1 prepilin-type N-terminal cleavage/methylation domain-containing protein [Candidatus Cloacimonadota bacterium]HPK40624.1 prepilin-type N-terminal cleavage/methylation domain-containing protein [Candidatus Cloacimonadota bacterium]